MNEKEKSMEKMQNVVLELVKKYNLETTIELRYIDLVSEVGELGKEILKGNNYGKEKFKKTDNIESEIGDVLFSLSCIANTLNINLEKVLNDVLKKYTDRFDKKGHIGSEESIDKC